MKELKPPKNQKAEILYELLTQEKITFKSVFLKTGIIELNARISDLRLDYDLIIPCSYIETINKHNRKIRYGSWKLINKELGLTIYNRVNKE
jgi:hypothetical protein